MKSFYDMRARLAELPGVEGTLREFFLASPTAFQLYSLDGQSLVVNQAFLELFGAPPRPEHRLFEDSSLLGSGYAEQVRAVFAGGPSQRFPVVWYERKNPKLAAEAGRWVALEATVFSIAGPDGRPAYGAMALKDVTKEERYLTELKESRHLLERAQEVARIGSWSRVLDSSNKVSWSPHEHRIFGVKEGAFGGTAEAFFEFVHPDDRDWLHERLRQMLAQGHGWEESYRIVQPGGDVRWLYEKAEVLPAAGDRPPRLIGITKDVTDEHRADERAKASEARFQNLFYARWFGYFVTRIDGIVTEANDAFLELTGYTRDDLQAGLLSWRNITPREYEEFDERALAQFQATGYCRPYEKEYVRKDGTRVPVLVGGAWNGEGQSEILSFAHDLSDQKRLEQQFHHSQRLESVGRLAGGVAHDFNNILGIILLYLDDLKTNKLSAAERRERLDTISKHVNRAIRLTKQLLAFGRRQVRAPRHVELNSVVEGLKEMLGRTVPESIDVEYHLGSGIGLVRADLSQLEQVLINLVTNARDAITGHGHVRICTDELSLSLDDLARLRLAVPKPGRYVRLRVVDNGSGIDEKLLPHIYEPFFTTKEIGQGTGLGLATVYGIARQSGGDVRVETRLGQGTTFEVYIPVEEGKPETESPRPRPQAPATARAEGLVLLVEDQEELRQLMSEILTKAGFRVMEARSGREALTRVQNTREAFHLIVSDVIMPEMTGPAFVRALEQMKGKTCPVMYVSGYPEAELSRHGIELAEITYLEKPFSKARFLERVKESLKPV